ncbi:MAG: hypothetical protein AAF657_26640, partial [Acidobacteriota bacterium]
IVAALICLAGASQAEGPVGFRVHDLRDPSRTFETWPDEGSSFSAAAASRPMRIFEWYPAIDGASGDTANPTRLTWADYVVFEHDDAYLSASPRSADPLPETKREAILARYVERSARRYEIAEAKVEALLARPTTAAWNRAPRPGQHPVVIARTMPMSIGLLAEHLAARGYVVLAPAHLAPHSWQHLDFVPNPQSLDTDIRDLQFVAARLPELPHVDPDRVAAAAFSSGTLPQLLWQMRDLRLRALVALEGWERFEAGVPVLEASPWYRPTALRVPHLLVEKAAEESNPSYAKSDTVLGAAVYARRERVTFEAASHGSFLSAARWFAGERPDDPSGAIHDCTLGVVTDFFDRHLKGVPPVAEKRIECRSAHTVDVREAAAPRPTEDELARLIERGEIERAAAILFAEGAPPDGLYRRRALRRVAQSLLDDSSKLEASRLISRLFPASAWAWIDVANACEALADEAGRLEAVRRALAALDDDADVSEERRPRLRTALREQLGG